MARIRHKRTLVERTVPDRAVKFFPDYEVIDPDAPAVTAPEDTRKKSRSRKAAESPAAEPAVESDTTEE